MSAPASFSQITVLRSAHEKTMTKSFQIGEDGRLAVTPYDKEWLFHRSSVTVANIADLANQVAWLSASPEAILIRGLPKLPLPLRTERRNDHFPEAEEGCAWVMIDIDQLPLPNGLDPLSVEAIEYAIGRLPAEFRLATYFYQFSTSAGILNQAGELLKPGLNVHIFFWLAAPVPGPVLAAYLQQHCIGTNFYEKTVDKGGQPLIRYGVDLSVIRSPIQPHYVAHPQIGEGVGCLLSAEQRQDFVRKSVDVVAIPPLAVGVVAQAKQAHDRLREAHAVALGFVRRPMLTQNANGAAVVSSFLHLPGAEVRTGRDFVRAEISTLSHGDGGSVDVARLFFADEGSPGSYYVTHKTPTLAKRYGDGSGVPLRELSLGAYVYVRDELKWFTDVPHEHLALTPDGYLPDFQTFIAARVSLVLAPTGSGKTTAFGRYVAANRGKIIIYAAQTIALTHQMVDALQAMALTVTHYKDWSRGDDLRPGVYVTTNESLQKFIEAAQACGRSYELAIDEVHMALDDFMRNNKKNELFERAVSRAVRTLFMTATLTPLQKKKLLEVTGAACGELNAEAFACYEFAPVKAHPLFWASVSDLGGDFVAMLRHYADLKSRGERIPRTILITPTSKMRPFDMLVKHLGLEDDALVVSRQESTPEEIEEARVSEKPLLICSPLFALGLNFEHAPERLWTYFSYLRVDTSQIIQTLNRANRAGTVCEVRVYAGELDGEPVLLPKEAVEQARIQGYLADESAYEGVLDLHFHVDRLTYLRLRECEKVTSKALYELKVADGVQNFRIVEDWDDPFCATEEDAELFKKAKVAAKESYDADIEEQISAVAAESIPMQFELLSRLNKEKQSPQTGGHGQVPKELDDKIKGIVCAVAEVGVDVGKKIKPSCLQRLHAERDPYVSAQFDAANSAVWHVVAAEKTEAIAPLCEELAALQEGMSDGIRFAQKMRGKLRRSVLALVRGDENFLAWQRTLDQLDRLSGEYKHRASRSRREEIHEEMFKIAQKFLVGVGVTFVASPSEVSREGQPHGGVFDVPVVGVKPKPSPQHPVVPATWNLPAMAHALARRARSLACRSGPVDVEKVDYCWAGPRVSSSLCQHCVHCDASQLCLLGRPTQFFEDDVEPVSTECDAFKRLPKALRCETGT